MVRGSLARKSKTLGKGWWSAVQVSACLVFLLFLAEFVEVLLQVRLEHLGILPRTFIGLRGILFSPFLHANAAHLVANAASLFVFLILLFWDRRYKPEQTLIAIWIISGAGTWLIGRPALHIGASSIIYGLATYLIVAGYYILKWRQVLVSISVALLYGGIYYGALPNSGPISWEGHLCGAIAGAIVARVQHR